MVTFRSGISSPEFTQESDSKSYTGGNAMLRQRMLTGRTARLIHESFPTMGEQKRAHEGSQSEAPLKEQSMDSMPREDSEEGQKVRPKMSDAPYQPPPKMNDVGGAYNNVQ
jgi:uncharacterized membrane protein